ncbi:MAG: hypothetical protein JXA38_05160 [Methanosarcinaceae archaeon]|nr:hypothetical protein [Methanosarcinaceae archaeon]
MAGKDSFETKTPIVLKIIEDYENEEGKNPEGIKQNELLKRLVKETGQKVSKHTLNKCLTTLIFNFQIQEIQGTGQGNPVYYKPLKVPYSNKFDENIKASLHEMGAFIDDKTPFGFEARHYRHIIGPLVDIFQSILVNMAAYSTNKKRYQAAQYYELFLEAQLLPAMRELKKLVEPPFIMSSETYSMLFNACALGVMDSITNMNHPLEETTESEDQEIDKYLLERDATTNKIEWGQCMPHFLSDDPKTKLCINENKYLSEIIKKNKRN